MLVNRGNSPRNVAGRRFSPLEWPQIPTSQPKVFVAKTPKRWLTEKEQDLWRSYLGAWFRLSETLNDDMEKNSGFDHLTYEIFVNLSEEPNRSLRMTELANRVSAHKSRLTYRVGQLEEQGLVERNTCEEDGRGQWCVLTDKGFTALKSAAPHHVDAVLTNFIEQIDPNQIENLTEIFGKISPSVPVRIQPKKAK